MSMAADITSKDITQDGDRNVSEKKITQPKKNGGKKARCEVPLLKLSDLKPKRPGAWYTEQELGRASALLQGVTTGDQYLHLRSSSGLMIAQIERLIYEFGVNRAARLHRAIITLEVGMNSKDISVMNTFTDKLVEEDREAFKAYIASIKTEELQEDPKLFKGGYLAYIKRTLEESGVQYKSISEIQDLLASMKDKRKTVKPNNTGERSRSPSPPGGGASASMRVADKMLTSIFFHYIKIRNKIALALSEHQESMRHSEEIRRAHSVVKYKVMTRHCSRR